MANILPNDACQQPSDSPRVFFVSANQPVSQRDLFLGIALITAAFFCAALMSALSKLATGIPPLMLLFVQYAISLLVFLPFVARGGIGMLRTKRLGLQCFRSISGSVCQLLFFLAVQSIPLMDSVLLANAAPLFIPIVVWIWCRKAVQPAVWVSLLIGLVGIILIIDPGPQMFENPASLIALAAAVFSALALVATNRLSETEPPMRILIYNFGISTILLIPLCITSWKTPASNQILLLLGVGGSYALTQYLIILAYRHASAAQISPFNYTVVIFSGLLGWLIFGNIPGPIAIIGTILICAGGILSIRAGHPEGHGHGFAMVHGNMSRRSPSSEPADRSNHINNQGAET